jgi:hypothetical protein
MFFDSEVEIYYDLLKNDQILSQCKPLCKWYTLSMSIVLCVNKSQFKGIVAHQCSIQWKKHLDFKTQFKI